MTWDCADFGVSKNGQTIKRFTAKTEGGVEVSIINYGGIITSIKTPDKTGRIEDVVAGFDTFEEYENGNADYFGVIIGRTANRTAKGKFSIDGEDFQLGINNGFNNNHGGVGGFHTKVWQYEVVDSCLKLTYESPDGEEGYPGKLDTVVVFELEPDNTLKVDFTSKTSKPTIVNLTSHSYFNLAGHKAPDLRDHTLQVNADRFTPKTDTAIPTGEMASVSGTLFDLRQPTKIAELLDQIPDGEGYDHNLCLSGEGPKRHAARLLHVPSGRYVDLHTDQPGLQVYTGHYVNVSGKDGAKYKPYSSVALEAQNYPDAVNQPTFPSSVLCPGEVYRHTTWYTFGVKSA